MTIQDKVIYKYITETILKQIEARLNTSKTLYFQIKPNVNN